MFYVISALDFGTPYLDLLTSVSLGSSNNYVTFIPLQSFILILFNVKKETPLSLKILTIIACEQALWGTLAEGVGGGGGWGRKESLQLCLWNLNNGVEKIGAKCWFAEVTWVMMSWPLAHVSFQCFCTFVFVSALRWLAEIWQLSRRGVTGVLEVEFKFQRHSSGLKINALKLAKCE